MINIVRSDTGKRVNLRVDIYLGNLLEKRFRNETNDR